MTQQFILDLAQPEPPTFANFVAGANREPLAAVIGIADGAFRENGVLLWGAHGAGKTHLLRAAAARARGSRPVFECGSPRELPVADPQPSALLVVDAIDTADVVAQARLFTLVNGLPGSGGQWLAAASSPPAALPLRDDLRTRLALGLVFEIVPLADRDKADALAAYAQQRGFRLSAEVIDYLLAHGQRDMATLVATLAALDRHSLATRRAITIPLLRDWLQRDLGLTR